MSEKLINVFEPSFGQEELDSLNKVFMNKWPGKGPEVNYFEEEFADYLKVPRDNVVTTNSCTEACFQILEYIKSDKTEVIIPTNSFIGIANAIISTGRKIVFCDIDPTTGNLDLSDLREKITRNTLAVVLQHFGGIPAQIKQICEELNRLGIVIIEDAAGALGSKYQNQHCGTFGDYGIWSFDAMKMVVAGDGGMIFAKNSSEVTEMRSRMYMGLDTSSGFKNSKNLKRWWEFQIEHHGRRSIMNDISASIARVQLAKLSVNIEARTKNYQKYISELAAYGDKLSFLKIDSAADVNHYFCPIFIKNGKRDELANFLQELNIYTTFRYFPLNKVSYFGKDNEIFPNSDNFSESLLLLPQHANLKNEDLNRIIEAIKEFCIKN